MGLSVHGDQAFLAAVTPFARWYIVGAIGELARAVGRRYANDKSVDLPEGPPPLTGLWCWEGEVEARYRSDGPPILDWCGSWRESVIGDFERFDMRTPLPRVPEGATHG